MKLLKDDNQRLHEELDKKNLDVQTVSGQVLYLERQLFESMKREDVLRKDCRAVQESLRVSSEECQSLKREDYELKSTIVDLRICNEDL